MCDALEQEMTEIALMCNDILKWKPDIVITEKGISDLAQHFLLKGNVSCIRRIRKTDNVRIARVSGAKIVNRPEEIQESDVGTECGLFDIRKIGDEYFSYFIECKNPSACSILLRGASKDVLNEMERNLHDCLGVSKNLYVDPRLVPGGGAIEMEISSRINEEASKYEGIEQLPFRAVGYALEVIPKTLATNCGIDVVRTITELRAKHAEKGNSTVGIDGNNKKIADMNDVNVWEPVAVKNQVLKTAIEASALLLRIDDVVSGVKRKQEEKQAPQGGMGGMGMPGMGGMGGMPPEAMETFGDARDG